MKTEDSRPRPRLPAPEDESIIGVPSLFLLQRVYATRLRLRGDASLLPSADVGRVLNSLSPAAAAVVLRKSRTRDRHRR